MLNQRLLFPFSVSVLCAVHAIYRRLLFIAEPFFMTQFECKLHFQLSSTGLLYLCSPLCLSPICSRWSLSCGPPSQFLHASWIQQAAFKVIVYKYQLSSSFPWLLNSNLQLTQGFFIFISPDELCNECTISQLLITYHVCSCCDSSHWVKMHFP